MYHGRDKWESDSSVVSIVSSSYKVYGWSARFKKVSLLTWGLDSTAQNHLAGYMLPVHSRLDGPALGYFLSCSEAININRFLGYATYMKSILIFKMSLFLQ
jgi:hypothetical protein